MRRIVAVVLLIQIRPGAILALVWIQHVPYQSIGRGLNFFRELFSILSRGPQGPCFVQAHSERSLHHTQE